MARTAAIGPTVVRELFGDEDPMGQVIQVGGVPFEITGIMLEKGTSAGGGDMDNRVFVPLATYMRRVANVDYLSAIRVQVEGIRDMEPAAADIAALLRERHTLGEGIPDDFRVTTPTEVTAMVEEMQGTFNLFLILVAGIALVVGGVVVANIMLLSVSERRRGDRASEGRGGQAPAHPGTVPAGVRRGDASWAGSPGCCLGVAGNLILERFTGTPALLTWHVMAR